MSRPILLPTEPRKANATKYHHHFPSHVERDGSTVSARGSGGGNPKLGHIAGSLPILECLTPDEHIPCIRECRKCLLQFLNCTGADRLLPVGIVPHVGRTAPNSALYGQ